jgi:predicted phage terminase large subunit-like protein
MTNPTATNPKLTAMVQLARTDPETFIRLILAKEDPTGRDPMATVHESLQKHLTDHPFALVELPRDHGKTTQVCLRVLWELGNNPNLRVKIVCASEAIAVDRSRFLRSSIEQNPRIRRVFPHLRKAQPWLATAFQVTRTPGILGPSVAAFGIGAASTGTRADLLVCDDVVDVKAIYSKAHRDRTADDFMNNLLNLLEPDGRFWGLSTPWHADDLNARLKKNESFALFRQPVGANLEPVWEEHWSREQLNRRRKEIGAAAFARGYRLTPMADDELVIRPEWVQVWRDLPEKFDRTILCIDPAVSVKPSADASALVVLAKAGNVVYCLSAQARRVAAPVLVQWIEMTAEAWKPQEIVFESNGAFDAVRELLVRHASFGPKVVGVKQSRSKLARFSAFAVNVEKGLFQLSSDGSQQALRDELTSFPFGEHDDLLDAAATGAMHLLGMRREPRMWI